MLAHRAMAQGEMVAEIVAGLSAAGTSAAFRRSASPTRKFVSSGLSPEEARAAGIDVQIGQFPFQANGRAMTTLSEDGFVRVIARADNHLVLGISGCRPWRFRNCRRLLRWAIEMGARLEDIAGTIHAHPTQSEASGGGLQDARARSAYVSGPGVPGPLRSPATRPQPIRSDA